VRNERTFTPPRGDTASPEECEKIYIMKSAEMPDRVAVLELLRGAEKIFNHVLVDVEPYHHESKLAHLLFFRRFTKLQYHYCRAIRTLFEADCWRGTIPLVRSLFEISVSQILLQRDEFSTMWELLKGERVHVADALEKIGWPRSENDIYAQLSRMTHPSRTSAFLGRTLDFQSEPLKTLTERKDLAGVASILLWKDEQERQDAGHERWVFLALNTFDVAISSLFTLYGAGAPEREWWDRSCIQTFKALAEHRPAMKGELLWFRLPWQNSKLSQLEQSIKRLPPT
jgi:hypothetical protein